MMLKNLKILRALEKKTLWLATWMIHHANNIRPASDGIKVGGHQASCASIVTVMIALYFHNLRPHDRVAVKPHAGPIFHAIQYLFGNQTLARLKNFRGLNGVQPYPSKTKDKADVDFSTGSVGLGVAETLFASLVQDYVHSHGFIKPNTKKGRMIAVLGDAELDEGNIFEALLEGWKHEITNCWWIIDYNRQSLDGVINDKLFNRITGFFSTVNWNVISIKYGLKLQAAFKTPIGPALKDWIDQCPNQLYSALTFQGGHAWRSELEQSLIGADGLDSFLERHDDTSLHELMTNLGGHDIEAILKAFAKAEKDERPHCFIAYTIKGYGLPLAGHKDNHAGILNSEQIDEYRSLLNIQKGQEWDIASGINVTNTELNEFINSVPFSKRVTRENLIHTPPQIEVPTIDVPKGAQQSTQEAFGKIMNELGKGSSELSSRIVTTSPDVTVSTNLGGWVNQRSPFHVKKHDDIFRQMHLPSPQKWSQQPLGQHIELGIAENNLFLLLSALGLSHDLFKERLIPIGTLYDPFVARGLDALTYACYQDSRFIVVGTPSGISLGPEGGAHQSIFTPLIGIGHPNLRSFEPAYGDELAKILQWGFQHIQKEKGSPLYIRLSTRPIEQPKRKVNSDLSSAIISGAYWEAKPAIDGKLIIAYCGVVANEAKAAFKIIAEDMPGAGLLAITSPDQIYANWTESKQEYNSRDCKSTIGKLLSQVDKEASIVTIHDGHPLALSWLGSVRGQYCLPLGVDKFGQAGNIKDLYAEYRIDTQAIVEAIAQTVIDKLKNT